VARLGREAVVCVVIMMSGWAGRAHGRQEQQPGTQAAEPPAPVAAPPARPITYSLSVRGDFAFNTELGDDPGDVTVSRAGINFSMGIPQGMRGQWGVGLDFERSNYDFSGATSLSSSNPDLNFDANITTLSVSYGKQENMQWGWLLGGTIGVAADDGAHLNESIVGSVFGGVSYAFSQDVRIAVGAIVATQIEDNLTVLPLVNIDWQINKRASVSNDRKPGLVFNYALDDSWTLRVGGQYEFRDFRLDRDGPIPNGVARDRRAPFFVGARYAPTKQIDIDVSAGVYFFQTFRVDDANGVKLEDTDADATPFLRIGFTYKF